MTEVGVVGLGIMGGSIAGHLVAAGFATGGYDVAEEARARAGQRGVTLADSVTELCAGKGAVFLSLASVQAARSVVGEIAAAGHGNLVIDTSTFPLAEKAELAAMLRSAGSIMLDCPISGTGAQMAAKDAVVYASGPAEGLSAARPLLDAIARQVVELGAFGKGTALKLVANHLVAIHNIATAEAMLLGMRSGIEPDVLIEAVRAGAGNSRIFELRAPMIAADRYEPATMKLDVWAKDMAAFAAFAQELGATTPLLDAAAPIYALAVGAVTRGYQYLDQYPGPAGWLLFAACTGAVFMAGAKILDATQRKPPAGEERRAHSDRRAPGKVRNGSYRHASR